MTITQRTPYLQPTEDRDDVNSHSSRVEKRLSEARNAFHSANHARLLFDQLWSDKEKLKEKVKPTAPPKQMGSISIKRLNGVQSTGFFNDFGGNDQWGSPEHIRR